MAQRQFLDRGAAATMIALCLIWGTQQVAIKLAAPDMAPLMQVGLRSAAAALVLFLIVLFRGEHHAICGTSWGPGLIVGLLFALEFILFAEGLRFTSASHMSIFLYTAPIFAALGLHYKLPEEQLAPIQWVGIAIAFTGIIVTFSARGDSPQDDFSWIGDVMGIAAGAAWGATTLVVRTTRLAATPASVTLLYQLVGAGLLATSAALALGQTTVTFSSTLLTSFAYQAMVISAASYLVWFALLRRYLASRLGVLSLLTPVFGIGLGVAILGDVLTGPFIVGTVVIIVGIILVNGRDLLASRNDPKPAP